MVNIGQLLYHLQPEGYTAKRAGPRGRIQGIQGPERVRRFEFEMD